MSLERLYYFYIYLYNNSYCDIYKMQCIVYATLIIFVDNNNNNNNNNMLTKKHRIYYSW